MFRLIYFIPIWLGYLFLIKIPVNLLGFLVVPFLYRYRTTDYADLPGWARLWSNIEDWQGGITAYGIESLPWWWIKRRQAKGFSGTSFRCFYKYHAFRNGGDGLRTTFFGGVAVDPDRIEYVAYPFMTWYEPWKLREQGRTRAIFLCWQGLKAGLKYVHVLEGKDEELHTVFKIGWRIEPKYAAFTDYRVENDPLLKIRSFATKFLWKHADQTKQKDYDK